MDAREFDEKAGVMLARIEALLEGCEAAAMDYEIRPGGVIEIEFDHAGGSQIVINRHAAAQEIWLAARSGGFHFRSDPEQAGRWVGTRDGAELLDVLARCMSEQAGTQIVFGL